MKNPDDKTSLLTLCKACELLIYSNTEYGNLTKHYLWFYSLTIAAMLQETLKIISESFSQKMSSWNWEALCCHVLMPHQTQIAISVTWIFSIKPALKLQVMQGMGVSFKKMFTSDVY